ncbi:GreA/GreB family elongation factor [Nocardiopsis composta]|uniref:Transcription elongation factor GreA n=1 Tax=Nocardiopsis composta TaxID=157465 RepID=A0A7W8QQ35_9ACTN|nr:GreA/GreB family elongation factor [Nocardiopsis composta]MBB5433536.1 transcription elongation factor GreA [Nocardiopsis composta]
MSRSGRTWLTPSTHDRLTRELNLLSGSPPEEGADTGEFDYIQDKDARDARIARIQEILKNAVVGEAPPNDGVAEPGMVLTVRYEGDDEPETFLLGVRDRADSEGLTVYSPESPLGTALVGARQGETRSYQAPNGRTFQVTLVKAVPYGEHAA